MGPIQQDKQTRQTRQLPQEAQNQRPELVQAVNALVLALDNRQLHANEAKTLKQALQELSALCK